MDPSKSDEIPKVVRSILDIVKTERTSEAKKSRGWIGALVVGVLAVIATAVLSFMAWRKGKQLAKLQHERDVRIQEELEANVDAKLAENDEERDSAMDEVSEALIKLIRLDADELRIETELNDIKRELSNLDSWDNIDRYTGRG